MTNLLSIAGFDPTSGAGIQADLKTFSRLGAYGLTVVTAITIQDSKGVKSILPINKRFLTGQLYCLANDLDIKGIKIGMIYSKSSVEAICDFLDDRPIKPIIYDPVLKASSGYLLMKKDAVKIVIERLIPMTTVVTPNIREAETLSGVVINSVESLKQSAIAIYKLGAKYVVITGGHFDEIDGKDITLETVYDGKEFVFIKGEKFHGEYHGTGCIFASALTCYITQGVDIVKSVKKAKTFVHNAIKNSKQIGKGMRLLMT